VKLLSHFPSDYLPYPTQISILEQLEEAFKTHKFVILCAPCGSGKSPITKTLSNSAADPSEEFVRLIKSHDAFATSFSGDYTHATECLVEPRFGAFALTITKNLQDQYKEMFPDCAAMKGKSNYQCIVDDRFDTESAPCIFASKVKDNCLSENCCPYYNARIDTLTNKLGVLNYSMFMALPKHVKYREYIICDEASELEEELVKKFSVVLNYKAMKRLGFDINAPSGYKEFFQWLVGFTMNVTDEMNSHKRKISKKGKEATVNERQKYIHLKTLSMTLTKVIDTWPDCEYVIETKPDGLSIVPLKVDNLSKEIFDYSNKVLLMSATIIDPTAFAKTLGITDFKYIEVESTFDPKKSPIYLSNKVRLSYKNLQQSLSWVAEQVKKICELHNNDKGIIHTHTMAITEFLQRSLKGDRFLYREKGQTNEMIMVDHKESLDNTVLVSPSMTHGINLYQDLSRFQIIIKAPFLPLSDKRIKRLFDEDSQWYTNRCLSTIVQASGRSTRSKDDYCKTYIIDGTVYDLILRNKIRLPSSFLKRLQ